MGFSFLNPWLWLGALAVAAPVWLHLRRRQEKNLWQFSAVRFLEDQPQPRRSPLRLRDLLLFVLRALAVLLLAGAFTWPYFRSASTTPITESRVYILDNTLSHQANNGFVHDRDQVASEISRAAPDVQAAVIELTGVPRVVAAFGDERQSALQKVKALQPSFQRGSFLAAFRQANTLLGNSLGTRKRILFRSDGQDNQWKENAAIPPFLRNIEVELPRVPPAPLPNLSLSEPRVQRIFLGDKSLVNFTVKLSHEGAAKTASLTLSANDQLILNRTVDLDQQPETLLVQAQWEADPASWLRGEAAVGGTPDALPGDDRVFFSLAPVVEGRVVLLAQSPYLRLALSPEIMRGQWATRLLDPARLGAELAANQDGDVFCIESNYLQSADARKLLWRYLTNGRGVLLLVNRVTPTIDGCLRELGFEAEGVIKTPKDKSEKFQFVFSNHPIFHPFLSPDYGNLMDVRVLSYVRLKATQAMPLVFGEGGSALFFQGAKLQGKLFVAAFGLDRDHTSWPIHQSFIPFLDLTLQAARAEDTTPASFEPGEMVPVQLPPAARAREVVLRDGQREWARAPVTPGKTQIRSPDKPGLYTLTYDDRTQAEKVISINPSPKESRLAYADGTEVMKTWRLDRPVGTASHPPPGPPPKISLAGVLQQRWWWWMVLGGLMALMLETALAAVKRERV